MYLKYYISGIKRCMINMASLFYMDVLRSSGHSEEDDTPNWILHNLFSDPEHGS